MKTRKDVWDMHDKLKEELGNELFLDEICKGLSVDNAIDLYEYIARNHDVDFDEKDDNNIIDTPMGFCMFGEGAEDLQKALDVFMEYTKRKKNVQ